MKNFITRTLTAIVYVVLLVGCTVLSPLSAFIFFALIAALCVGEFCKVLNRHYCAEINTPIVTLTAFLLVSVAWESRVGLGNMQEGQLIFLMGTSMLFLIISELYRQSTNPLRNWSLAFAGLMYTALPFALLPSIAIHYDVYNNAPIYEWIYPLALFIFLWANDTGAYLVGSMLGRYVPYKLFPRISPNKSWVGSIGGGLLTLAAAAVIYTLRPAELNLLQWLGFGLTVVFFGTWGDLVESMLKRQLGIKDSGHILPGHGGMLDRFDSALLAIPAAAIYFYYILG
ncbi:MAG: phosphatidate cytidylyltransferase [Bacteroidaceae bacterium]|nr:phosphatidate cytidylyltransferase [Bacteroidaceae bacterium]